jgi:putative transposase
MDTQKVASEYRLSQWAQVIKAQQESGQNIKDNCQTNGISRNAYFYWQRKLRKVACTELTKTEGPRNIVPNGWIQLTTKQTNHVKDVLNIEINELLFLVINLQSLLYGT